MNGLEESGVRAYVDPYGDPITFNMVRPRYIWLPGDGDEDLVLQALARLRGERGLDYRQAIELGSVDGCLSGLMADVCDQVLCMDPAPEQVEECRTRHGHLPGYAFTVGTAHHLPGTDLLARCDLLTSFWALTYPVQAYFGLGQRPDGTFEQSIPTETGEAMAREFLAALMDTSRPCDYLFLVYDENSVEQRWVTRAWSEVAAFPGERRAMSLDLIFDQLMAMEDSGRFAVDVEHIRGELVCESEEDLVHTFVHHHLRGIVSERSGAGEALKRDMLRYRTPEGRYGVPAGAYLVSVSSLAR